MNVGSVKSNQALARSWRLARIVLPLVSAAFFGGCFVNPGQQMLPSSSMQVSITPVYNSATNSYMTASGNCGDAQLVKFIYSSPLTPSNTVVASCVNGKVSAQLPVANGTQDQTFTVELMGQIRTSSGTTENMSVLYAPPVPLTAGFAIEVGGGIITDGGLVSINSSVGEIFNPATIADGGGNSVRTGVQGVNDP